MSKPLARRVALVTGAGRGIGRAIAERLARLGADVVVHDLHHEAASEFGESASLDDVTEALRGLGQRACGVTGDLTDPATAERVVAKAVTELGPLEILVNNAGGDIAADGRSKAVPNDAFISPQDLEAILQRNLLSTMNTSRAAARHMLATACRGRIVNIASLAGLAATIHETAYAVAKAGVIHYTRCLAVQLRPHGINVNAVAPGRIKSARWLATIDHRAGARELLDETHPLLRLGEPADVARVVEFFVGEAAAYVTGEVLRVDGGLQVTTGSGQG